MQKPLLSRRPWQGLAWPIWAWLGLALGLKPGRNSTNPGALVQLPIFTDCLVAGLLGAFERCLSAGSENDHSDLKVLMESIDDDDDDTDEEGNNTELRLFSRQRLRLSTWLCTINGP
jgi:hypothetical protein